MSKISEPIIVEQSFGAARATVWKAITEHDQMIQWFFADIPDFKAEVGFETRFNVNSGQRDFLHVWKILDAVVDEKIVYDWRYDGLPGEGKVTFELTDAGEGCRLRVTSEGLETFPRDIPEFTREAGVAGWTYFIQGRLKDYVQGKVK